MSKDKWSINTGGENEKENDSQWKKRGLGGLCKGKTKIHWSTATNTHVGWAGGKG